MRIFILITLILSSNYFAISSRYIIDYKPSGRIISFSLDSIIIITDINAIECLINFDNERNWILKNSNNIVRDTIRMFDKWPIENILKQLIANNKCKVIYHGNNINHIKIKKRKKWFRYRTYYEFYDIISNKIFYIKPITTGYYNPKYPPF
jgi:hypothetical protein